MNPADRSVLREGIVAGLIGAAVVAIWFFVFDLLRGRPFLTPTLLGSFVFFGVNTPTGLEPALGPILGYTVLHGLAFVAFGVVAATMMAMSEREPALFIAFVILFAAFEVFFFGVLSVLGRGMQTALAHIDDFMPAHNLASLEDLAAHLRQLGSTRHGHQQHL